MSCFNGAADFHPRKRRQAARCCSVPSRASMGPRTSIRGNDALRSSVIRARRVRRASMGPRTSIRGNTAVLDGASQGNGERVGRHASMGPRTSIRGNRRPCATRSCRCHRASMGPRTSIRGNCRDAGRDIAPQRVRSLQWGRGLPSAETHVRKGFATSRPTERVLQWGRGLPSAETGPSPARLDLERSSTLASMGPRTSIRGNGRAPDRRHGCLASYSLQWGRGLPSAETPCHPRLTTRTRAIMLQWGRGLPSAETDARRGLREATSVRQTCFNGAADFHPRKQHAFEVFSCQRLALPLASAGRQTVDWTKRTLVPNPQLHACQHLPAASGHRVFALTSTLAPAAKAAHRVSNPW